MKAMMASLSIKAESSPGATGTGAGDGEPGLRLFPPVVEAEGAARSPLALPCGELASSDAFRLVAGGGGAGEAARDPGRPARAGLVARRDKEPG